MINDTVQAPSQPVEAPSAPETHSDAKKGNLTVAQAAQRLLNMEAENAKAQAAVAEQNSPDNSTSAPEEAPAESAAAEPQAEAQAEDSGEADVPSQDITPELQKKIDKRIGKEVAKRKALEAQLNEIKVAMAQAQSQQQSQPAAQPAPLAPLPSNVPLAQIEDPQALVALQQQAKEAKRFAQEQLDRDDFEPFKMGNQVINRDALKTILRNAEKTLEDDIPARAQFLQSKLQVSQAAYEKFPFLKDKSTPEYVMAQQAYIAMPWLKNLPQADWIIGVQIEGLKAMEARDKSRGKTGKSVPVSKTPPQAQALVSSGGSESRASGATRSSTQLDAMRSAMSKKGGVSANEAAQFLLARELAKTNR